MTVFMSRRPRSASRRIRRLYSAVKRRRFAFSVTSVLDLSVDNETTFCIVHVILALLGFFIHLTGGACLTIVGTEDSADAIRGASAQRN